MKQLPTSDPVLGNFMGNFDWTIPDILRLRNYPRNRNPLVMRCMMTVLIMKFEKFSLVKLLIHFTLQKLQNVLWASSQFGHTKGYKWWQDWWREVLVFLIGYFEHGPFSHAEDIRRHRLDDIVPKRKTFLERKWIVWYFRHQIWKM